MTTRERALRVLGLKKFTLKSGYEIQPEYMPDELLIGLLILKLDRLSDRDFCYYGLNHCVGYVGGGVQVVGFGSELIEAESELLLGAFVQAVETAEKEKP